MVFCFLSSEGFVLGVVRSCRSEGWGLNYASRWGYGGRLVFECFLVCL